MWAAARESGWLAELAELATGVWVPRATETPRRLQLQVLTESALGQNSSTPRRWNQETRGSPKAWSWLAPSRLP